MENGTKTQQNWINFFQLFKNSRHLNRMNTSKWRTFCNGNTKCIPVFFTQRRWIILFQHQRHQIIITLNNFFSKHIDFDLKLNFCIFETFFECFFSNKFEKISTNNNHTLSSCYSHRWIIITIFQSQICAMVDECFRNIFHS